MLKRKKKKYKYMDQEILGSQVQLLSICDIMQENKMLRNRLNLYKKILNSVYGVNNQTIKKL